MTVVTRSPGAVGSGPWLNFEVSSLQVSDSSLATAYLNINSLTEYTQSASAFGFAIPADATITSLTVEGECAFTGEISAPRFLYLDPYSAGGFFFGPGAHADVSVGESAAGFTIIQGVADPNLPTVAQLNSPDFAVVANAGRGAGGDATVYLNYITLTVEYDEYVPPDEPPPPPPEATPPSVVTWDVVDITTTTANTGGIVTSDGGADVAVCGIFWGTSPNPWQSGTQTDGPGAEGFALGMTGLTPATRYYVAAWAHNSAGYGFGAVRTFVTLPVVPTVVTWEVIDIAADSATGGGNVTAGGGAAVDDMGFFWGTSPNPRGAALHTAAGVAAFRIRMTGLTPATRYYVAAFAHNSAGYAFGADVTFVTHAPPTVATAGVYDITATAATGGGDVSSDGGEAVTARGVCWSVGENPTTAVNIIPAMTSNTAPSGTVSASSVYGGDANHPSWKAFDHVNPPSGTEGWIGGSGATTAWLQYQFPVAHVVRRYAVTSRNEATPRAPRTWTFKGSNNGTTWVTLDTQTNITDWAASGNVRKVFPLANVTAYAYYRLDITASTDASTVGVGELEMMETVNDTLDGSGLGAFISHLTGLTEGTTYNVRAYAVNAVGTAYGAAVTFTATADAPPVEPPLGPPRDPSQNLLFDGTLELMVGTLDVAGSATQVKYSNSNPGGFGNLSFRLPADAPYAAFDAQVVKGAAVTLRHGLVGFAATLFEGEVTSDVSHATIAGGKAYYDVTCAGLWWKAGQRKDFSMVVGDDDYGQWYAMDDNAKAFQVSTDGKLEIRLAAGQSAAAGDSASLYYWLGKGLGDPAASIDFLFGVLKLYVMGAGWVGTVQSSPTPWGPWTECARWADGYVLEPGRAECLAILGDNPQTLKLQLSTTSAVDTVDADRFVSLDRMAVGSGVSANGLSAVSAANPTVVTSTGGHGLKTGDRVFITQSSASVPTISGWRTVTVTDGAHFTVPVAVTTAGGAGTFYKATRIDQALVKAAVTTGLASLASLQPGGVGNLNWGLVVRPHASRAGGIDLLAATNVAPFDYGFWDNATFYCQDRPLAIRALHDYLIDSSLPGIDFDVRRATEDSPSTVKVLYKFHAEDGETSPYPDGTALAVYRTAAGYSTVAIGVTGNIIPAMTSNTTPSGVVTSSGNYDADRAAWKAFNHQNPPDEAAGWVATLGTTGWLQYQFPAAHIITRYAVTSRGHIPCPPKTWTFKGSNDGSTWATLDTQTNVTDWAATYNVRKVFDFVNTVAYAYYRLDITASTDASTVGVGELEMMEAASRAPEWSDASPVLDVWTEWADMSLTTAQAGDLGDQILAWLSANAYQGGGTIAPATLPLRDAGYTDNIIPAMTSATAPSGVASESGHLSTHAAWRAFDHTNPAGGASGEWVSNAVAGYIQYQFPAAHTITRYAVTSRNEASPRAPKTWTFKGSTNGTTWVTLDTQTNVTDWASTPNLRKVFDIANTTAYAYYRLDITASNDAAYVGVGELEMMGGVPMVNCTAPTAYIRGGDYIEDVNLDTGPLMITGFSMDADRGVATIGIGENRRAFVERLTPDKA